MSFNFVIKKSNDFFYYFTVMHFLWKNKYLFIILLDTCTGFSGKCIGIINCAYF